MRSTALRAGHPCGGRRKSATMSMASVAEPPLPNTSSRAAALEDAAERGRGAEQRLPPFGERLRAERPDLLRLHEHRGAHVGDDGLEIVLLLAEERIEKARGAGIVHRPRVPAVQQPAMIEEDVDELPEHVVQRLRQLLADEWIVARRLEVPRRPRAGERDGETPAGLGDLERLGGLVAPRRSRTPWRCRPARATRSTWSGSGPPSRAQTDGRQGPLADDDGVHELHRHVPHVRPRRRRGAERDESAPARESLRHLVAQRGDAARLALEEESVGLRADGHEPVEPADTTGRGRQVTRARLAGLRHGSATRATLRFPLRCARSPACAALRGSPPARSAERRPGRSRDGAADRSC